MTKHKRIPAFCTQCRSRCGCEVILEKDKLLRIEPLPDHPSGEKLCPKGKAAAEVVYHPDRLKHPMRRTSPKGMLNPTWEQISWEEALDEIAGHMARIRADHGAEQVAFSITTPSGTHMSDCISWVERFVRAYGSPNSIYGTEICNWHKDIASRFTVGDPVQSFKHEAAKRIIAAVEKEWDRRLPYIRLNPDHFVWPRTEATKGTGTFEIGHSPDIGMLAYMEYRVGRTNGQPVGVRRAILDRVVEGTLPLYGGIEYYDQWGKPNSAGRLHKLAEAIAAFTRNAKRRGKVRLADAISEWEADLEYLYTVYYLSRFGFGWPST